MLDGWTDRQTDTSVRPLVNQNMCNLSILGIHVGDSNIRVHLDMAQGEKVQNLKELPAKFVHSTGSWADSACNSSNNQVFFGWNGKQICILMQCGCKYVCCKVSPVVLLVRWKLNVKQKMPRNVTCIQVSSLKNYHLRVNMLQSVMEGRISQNTWHKNVNNSLHSLNIKQ